MRRFLALAPLLLSIAALGITALPGCGSDGLGDAGEGGHDEDAHEATAESGLTTAEKEAICDAIPTPRAWTREEADLLLATVVRRAAEQKRANDALVAQRGVGGLAGARTELWKAIGRGDMSAAAAIVRPKLRPGHDALRVAGEIQGTSCIGWVYRVLKEAYGALGRGGEWAAIERCGRAWDSDGLHVQQALIKNGWPSPTIGFVSDRSALPGSATEVGVHTEFLRAQARGSYFGTPVSRTRLMKDFLPSPGSRTPVDEAYFLRLGRSSTLAFGTFRGAYHVPFVVPAATVPADLAPGGSARAAWLAARERGEPFVLESHSLRQPWDPTNLEIRPLKAVIAETFPERVTYATGTLIMAPHGEALLE